MSNASELAEFGAAIQPPGDNLIVGIVTANLFSGTVDGSLSGDVSGNITGNVTGDVVGDVIGNLTTPTAQVSVNDTGVNVSGIVTATSIVKSGGTSSEFLKADGSVDSNSYVTAANSVSTGKAIAMAMIFG